MPSVLDGINSNDEIRYETLPTPSKFYDDDNYALYETLPSRPTLSNRSELRPSSLSDSITLKEDNDVESFYNRHLTITEISADVFQKMGSRISIHVVSLQSESENEDKKFSKEKMIKALENLANSHPILWMKVKAIEPTAFTKSVNKRFTEITKSERKINLTYLNECALSWLQVIEDQLMNNFDSLTGPLWRCVFLEEKTKPKFIPKSDQSFIKSNKINVKIQSGILIFIIHDVISDSISVSDLLLNQLPQCLSSPDIETTVIPQAPPVDDSFPLHDKSTSLLNSLRRSLRKKSSLKKIKNKSVIKISFPLLHVGEDPMLTIGSETRVMLIDLELNTKRRFDHCCQERNILAEDALMVASSIALKLATKEQKKSNPYLVLNQDIISRIKCIRERNLRCYANIENKEGRPPLGLWSISEQVNVDCISLNQLQSKYPSSNAFWEDVILASTSRNEEPWSTLKDFSDIRATSDYELVVAMNSKLKQAHLKFEYIKNSVKFSNEYSSSSHYYGHSLKDFDLVSLGVHCSDINNNKLSICITYNSRWLTREFTKCYAETLHKLIIKVSNPLKANMKKILKLPAYIRQQYFDKL